MSETDQRIAFVSDIRAMPAPSSGSEATSVVGYRSDGHLLLIADLATGLALLPRIALPTVTLVAVDPAADAIERQLTETGVVVYRTTELALDGHLGAFVATAVCGERRLNLGEALATADACFDLVLDLGTKPRFTRRLPPFGYHAPSDEEALQGALAELAESVGEFEKPRYFDYRAEICAHGRSGLAGCSRCIDACATGAITSFGDRVSVDPFLCQGCGSCATVCPSGAMVYAFPKPADAIAESRRLLGEQPVRMLLLHTEGQQAEVDALPASPELLPLVVEEVTAYGIDYWASMLCSGVHRIIVLVDADPDHLDRRMLGQQIDLLQRLLAGLGIEQPIMELLDSTQLPSLPELLVEDPMLAGLTPRHFATHNEKRQSVRSALDVLREQLPPVTEVVTLPDGSPFGRVRVDTAACTLCMGCVSTCPAGALLDGQETPALRMVEANCVQCGLCALACPEDAITLEPRYVFDSLAARKSVVLHEAEPFHCVSCHKPFATRAIIDRMSAKLSDHWMFQDESARRRLKMCEDCRVRDLFGDGGQGIDVHGGPT